MKSLAPLRLLGLVVWLAAWSAVAVADCTSPDGQEGTMDYNFTTHQFEYCDESDTWQPLGSGGGSLATLSDVSASAPFDGAVLRYNNSASKWETVDVSAAMSTTTMVDDWPDALSCSGSAGSAILYHNNTNGSSGVHFYENHTGADYYVYIVFTSAGNYSSHANNAYGNYFTDCLSKSIATLYSEGKAFNFIGGTSGNSTAFGDRITSGTLRVTANSATSIISLSTGGTTWGYLGSGASYLPTIAAGRVSATNISSTYVQLSSATTVLSCNAGATGTMRYTSGTMQVCDGSSWGNIGIGVPTGTIAAFAASSCPTGWTEYTSARGRFLRGIDNGAGNDPDGTRVPGTLQADEFKSHSHNMNFDGGTDTNTVTATPARQRALTSPGPAVMATGGAETRPKNVAVTFCQYAGFGSGAGVDLSNQTPTFQNGWVNYGNDHPPASYFKDASGVVHLRGLVKDGSAGGFTCIFTLPTGYRPAYRELFAAIQGGGVSRVDVAVTGCVYVQNAYTSWLSLSGISFRADQ